MRGFEDFATDTGDDVYFDEDPWVVPSLEHQSHQVHHYPITPSRGKVVSDDDSEDEASEYGGTGSEWAAHNRIKELAQRGWTSQPEQPLPQSETIDEPPVRQTPQQSSKKNIQRDEWWSPDRQHSSLAHIAENETQDEGELVAQIDHLQEMLRARRAKQRLEGVKCASPSTTIKHRTVATPRRHVSPVGKPQLQRSGLKQQPQQKVRKNFEKHSKRSNVRESSSQDDHEQVSNNYYSEVNTGIAQPEYESTEDHMRQSIESTQSVDHDSTHYGSQSHCTGSDPTHTQWSNRIPHRAEQRDLNINNSHPHVKRNESKQPFVRKDESPSDQSLPSRGSTYQSQAVVSSGEGHTRQQWSGDINQLNYFKPEEQSEIESQAVTSEITSVEGFRGRQSPAVSYVSSLRQKWDKSAPSSPSVSTTGRQQQPSRKYSLDEVNAIHKQVVNASNDVALRQQNPSPAADVAAARKAASSRSERFESAPATQRCPTAQASQRQFDYANILTDFDSQLQRVVQPTRQSAFPAPSPDYKTLYQQEQVKAQTLESELLSALRNSAGAEYNSISEVIDSMRMMNTTASSNTNQQQRTVVHQVVPQREAVQSQPLPIRRMQPQVTPAPRSPKSPTSPVASPSPLKDITNVSYVSSAGCSSNGATPDIMVTSPSPPVPHVQWLPTRLPSKSPESDCSTVCDGRSGAQLLLQLVARQKQRNHHQQQREFKQLESPNESLIELCS